MAKRQTGSDTTSLASAANQYRMRPIVVTALQWTGEDESTDAIAAMLGERCSEVATFGQKHLNLTVGADGEMYVGVGDWVAINSEDDVLVYSSATFAMAYEPVTAEQAAAHITPEPGDDCYVGTLACWENSHVVVLKESAGPELGTRFHCFPILERGEGNSNG